MSKPQTTPKALHPLMGALWWALLTPRKLSGSLLLDPLMIRWWSAGDPLTSGRRADHQRVSGGASLIAVRSHSAIASPSDPARNRNPNRNPIADFLSRLGVGLGSGVEVGYPQLAALHWIAALSAICTEHYSCRITSPPPFQSRRRLRPECHTADCAWGPFHSFSVEVDLNNYQELACSTENLAISMWIDGLQGSATAFRR